MDKIKLGMLGSCVTRDAMQTVIDRYDIQNYVTFVSPYTMQNGTAVDMPESVFADRGISNFAIKCLRLDANNKAVDYLSEFKSDWFLLDLIPLQGKIYEWPQYGLLLTQPHQYSKCIPALKEYLKGEPIVKECWEVPKEVLYERVRQLCKRLLTFLNPSRIILNETYGAYDFIGKLKTLTNFNAQITEQFKKINAIYKECNKICKECLPGCHVICPISNVVAFENHRWGLHPLHYCDEYYDYVAKSVSAIINRGNPESEKLELQYLNDIYNQKFITIREQAKCEAVKLDRDKWRAYSYTFKQLCFYLSEAPIDYEFIKNGYKHIAIYGDTEICKALVAALADSDVKIDYIVENANRPVGDIPTLTRGGVQYPDTDIMLIADIYNYNSISVKLERLHLPFPICNAADFLIELLENTSEAHNRKIVKMKYLSELKQNTEKLTKENFEYRELLNTVSYKLGRAMTFIPRKMQELFKNK